MVRRSVPSARVAARVQPRGTSPALRALVVPAVAIVVMTFAAYAPAIGAGFVWDDDLYVTANPLLHDGAGLWKMWFQLGATNMYVPLTFTTLWAGHQLWGVSALGYHLVNIALHASVALLFWAVLRKLGVPGGWFAGALVAVHPVFVESVAWVTELRNVQSNLLCLLCLLAYLRFARFDEPATREARSERDSVSGIRPDRGWPGWYALALLLFAGSLLSKPSSVGLPAVILLLTWWKRGRVASADLLRLAPLFTMSVAVGFLTMYTDTHFAGGPAVTWRMTLLERVLVAGRSAWFYVGKIAWPYPLMSIYPRWDISTAAWWQYLYPIAGAAALVALWQLRRTIGRGPLVAALSFLVMVAPTTGLFRHSYHVYSFVADHHQYHAAPALIALAAAGVVTLRRTLRGRRSSRAVDVAGALAVLLLGTLSARHAQAFENEKTRCLDTLSRNPAAWSAMNNLGVALNAEGRHEEAIEWYRKAIEARGSYPEAHNNMGVALVALGRPREAVQQYEDALRLWPDFPAARNNLGNALASVGDNEGAIRQYREALRVKPDYPDARVNLARALAAAGDVSDAIREQRTALASRPDYARGHYDLGVTLARAGRMPEAIEAYREALRIDPADANAHAALGSALAETGRQDEAAREYQEALRLAPRSVAALNGLGMAEAAEGRTAEAIHYFEQAVRIDPNDPDAQHSLGTALASRGDFSGAIQHYREAVRLRPDYVDAFMNLGKALLSEGEAREAARQFEAVVRLEPRHAEAHNLLGICLAETGRLGEAVGQFEQALRIKADYQSARENLERARAMRRR